MSGGIADDQLAAAYLEGKTLEELAGAAGMSPGTVRNRVRAAGVALRPPGRRAGVMSQGAEMTRPPAQSSQLDGRISALDVGYWVDGGTYLKEGRSHRLIAPSSGGRWVARVTVDDEEQVHEIPEDVALSLVSALQEACRIAGIREEP